MGDELEQSIAANIADQISKGVVSYNRARKQLDSMGSTPGLTIDVGNVIAWLDRNVKRIGYEEEPDENGIILPTDHSGYYTGGNDDGTNMLEAAKMDAIEAKQYQYLVQRPGQPLVNVHELAKAQNRVIDVSDRVKELTTQADEELGIVDVDPYEGD
jgi:hypothetical protein